METVGQFCDCVNRLLSSCSPVQFEGFRLEKWSTNHLVMDIVGNQMDCIFASLFVDSDSAVNESRVIDKTIVADELNVIGSPLKLHDYLKDVKYSVYSCPTSGLHINLQPVSLVQARSLLSLYNLSYQQRMKDQVWPPLWVLCDGQDSKHTAFLSSGKTIKHCDNKMAAVFSGNDSNSNVTDYGNIEGVEDEVCVISGYCVSETGPLTDQSKTPNFESFVSEYILKKPHKADYIAKYELIGRPAGGADVSQIKHQSQRGDSDSGDWSDNDDVAGNGGSMTVEATLQWNKHCELLDEPPLDASAVLLISPVSGDPQSAVYSMYSDLCTLQGFISGLSEGRVKWAVVDSDVLLIDRVRRLIQDQQVGDGSRPAVRSTSSCGSTAIDDNAGVSALKHVYLPERQDLDFTEQLWNILQDCSSYSDLVNCLQHVVDCLHRGTLQPAVHIQNKTKLGELIRESYFGRLDPSILSRLQPLQLLVDVGFDKLFRDYTHAFLAKDLVTVTHLSALTEAATSVDCRINQLLKLHRCLEMIISLEQRIKLPRPLLCTLARQVLKYYTANELTSQDVFTLPVQTIAISQLLKSTRPKLWKASFIAASTRSGGPNHASVAMTLTPSYPHLSLPPITDDTNDHKRFAGYYVTVASESTTVL